ncbi:MAG TPA: cyanophycin synthetase, partial [Flavobacterium sp.]|nr:cyanophycin synthetase [Flavobacterium sp.]
ETKRKLAKALIPVPKGDICTNEDQLKDVIAKIGYPIVIKPLKGNQGRGASINVTDWDSARRGLDITRSYGKFAVVEKYIPGYDFRVLVINHKFVAAAKRMPAHVVGDGVSTIRHLVDLVNADPKRGAGHENVLTQIKLGEDALELLRKNNYSVDSVPPKGETVFLKATANLSTGGTAIDVTDDVHPEVIFMAERISRVINLDICGIDIMAQNIQQPLAQTGGVVLEVNAAPGFRMHLEPSEGKPRNVAAAVLDMLYPPGKPTSVPIIAITGTNGKTTTTRLMAHVVKNSGFNVGYTTTDGIYIGDYLMQSGDTTGPISSKFILSDPSVDFAVLETARGGLLRSGLTFSQCDIGIITNIQEDHLGQNDIETIEDLANVKAVVVRSVKKDGWAILNAQNEYCVKIAEELSCNIAFFSTDENNEVVQQHIANGNLAGIYENGFLTIVRGNDRRRIENVAKVPLTCEGKCDFNIANALAVALAAHLSGFSDEQIKEPLQSFKPSFEHTPGRLNLFESGDLKVLVDYAHNPHGYLAIESYLKNVEANRKIGIITGVGDRRDEDIRECALIACRMFDHVIIRFDKDLRGSSADRIVNLLVDGLACGDKKVTHEIVPDELDAIYHALAIAKPGDFIVSLSEEYKNVVKVIQEEFAKDVPTFALKQEQQSVAS